MRRSNALSFGLAAVALSIACTYDFDQYVSSSEDAGGAAGTTGPSGGSTTGGTGGSSAGGATAGGTNAGGDGASAADGGENGGSAGTADPGETGGEDAGEGGAGVGPTSGGATSASGGNSGGKGGGSGGASGGKAGSSGGTSGASAGGGQGGGGFDCAKASGTVYGGHCYFLIGEGNGLEWEAAKTQCEKATPGGHLVTITSEAEEQFIESTFFPATDDRWIGLAIEDTRGNPPNSCRNNPASCPFLWVTSESLSYSKWGSHSATDVEPNYSGGCVRIQPSPIDWGDLDCDDNHSAICETN